MECLICGSKRFLKESSKLLNLFYISFSLNTSSLPFNEFNYNELRLCYKCRQSLTSLELDFKNIKEIQSRVLNKKEELKGKLIESNLKYTESSSNSTSLTFTARNSFCRQLNGKENEIPPTSAALTVCPGQIESDVFTDLIPPLELKAEPVESTNNYEDFSFNELESENCEIQSQNSQETNISQLIEELEFPETSSPDLLPFDDEDWNLSLISPPADSSQKEILDQFNEDEKEQAKNIERNAMHNEKLKVEAATRISYVKLRRIEDFIPNEQMFRVIKLKGKRVFPEPKRKKKKWVNPNPKLIKCLVPNCPFKTKSEIYRDAHMRMHEGMEKPWRCQTCKKTFFRRTRMLDHAQVHTKPSENKEEALLCKFCGKVCDFQLQLQRHEKFCLMFKERAAARRGICHICNLEIGNLARHMLHHENGHVCLACGQKFENSKDLAKHKSEKHSKKNLPSKEICPECLKEFKNKRTLKSHSERVHEKAFKHFCSVCSKGYINIAHLRIHMATHDESKKVPCTFPGCGKKFNSPTLFNQHFRIHTGTKPFSCQFCPKRFISSTNLTVHESTHSSETPFICEKCGKGFKCQAFLRLHMLWHEGTYKEAKERNRKNKLEQKRSMKKKKKEN